MPGLNTGEVESSQRSSPVNAVKREFPAASPVQQSLGKENYGHTTHQSDAPENPKPPPVKKNPPPEDSLTQKIIEDLKPKAEAHAWRNPVL